MSQPSPARRARRGALTRESILHAAQEQAGDSGLESLSSRTLAARLGVTPMALYRHVRDMDEIVGALVDELLGAVGTPDRSVGWRTWLELLAQDLRDLFRDHPAALGLFTRQPVTTPAARHRLEDAVAVLTAADFPPDEAVRAYAALHTYTVGFCALEAARRRSPEETAQLNEAEDPFSVAIRGFVTEEQFLVGLRALVDGLDSRVGQP
ncbi:MAG TPA: TetR/AcrR family transcriptional regulator C-terminal domain-containing protein [Dermatophilaceae bacterium]